MERLIESIKKHEGYRDHVYRDSLGYLTCGWGHALHVGSKIPLEAAEAFLKQDVADAVRDYFKLAPSLGADTLRGLNMARRRVIVEMLFNLGLPGVLKFRKMWDAIKRRQWEQASMEMLDSLWADQVGKKPGQRAWVLAEIMKKGDEI